MSYKSLIPTYRTRQRFISGQLARMKQERGVFERMLHVGSGEGELDPLLARFCRELISCDINAGDVERASALNAHLPNVRYAVEDGQRLNHPDDAFDCVVCIEVVEHVQEPRPFLAELARVLKPNGRLVLTCPNHDFPVTYDPLNLALRRFSKPLPVGAYGYGHDWLPEDTDLRDWFRAAGLQVIDFERLTHALAGLAELYVPSVMQRLFKANASNRSANSRGISIAPSTRQPPLLGLVDALIDADARWAQRSARSVGLAYVLSKPEGE